MALDFVDSFQHVTTLTDKWDAVNDDTGITIEAGTGPRAGNCLKWDSSHNAWIDRALTAETRDHWFGFRLKHSGSLSGTYILTLLNGASPVVYFILGADLFIRAYKPAVVGNDLLGTSAGPILGDSWQSLRFYFHLDSDAGRVQVKLGGRTLMNVVGNTVGFGDPSAFSAYRLGGIHSGSGDIIRWADFWAADSDQGALEIDAYMPVGDVATDWTPSAGANHECVDDNPPNGDTDYVETDTLDAIDAYQYAVTDVPGSVIMGLAVNVFLKKTDSGDATAATAVISGEADFQSDPQNVGDDDHVLQSVWDLDPATSAPWTTAAINAAAFGAKKTS